jgi:Ca2+-transporting ATPase
MCVCVCVCVCVGISEASLTGESVIKKKGPFVLGEGPESAVKVSPALFQGTLVQEGQGRMLVLAVGENTYQGLMTKKMEEEEDEKTVLQTKLDDMTELITKAGAVAGCCTVGILLLRFALAFMNHACCKESFNHKIHHLEWLRFLVVGVTVFVVAVPEGLPLAVAITLSLSVGKMQKDNCLVRHMSSCETMGSATTICSDKTGTLTTGKMTVVKVWSGGQSDPTVRETVSRLSGMCVCVCVCMFSVCVVTLLALFSAAADDAGGGGGDQLVVQVGRDIQ